MLGWLCIVQSLWAYTPGIRAGAILLGLPPLVQARMLAVSHTKPLHDAVAQMADDLYGGFAPKQGCFDCLPKVLHDAKPTEQAISDTQFLIIKRFFDSLKSHNVYDGCGILLIRNQVTDYFIGTAVTMQRRIT